jgi:chaperonin cofactor prefoldin
MQPTNQSVNNDLIKGLEYRDRDLDVRIENLEKQLKNKGHTLRGMNYELEKAPDTVELA